jgi:hypothetical protein
MNSALQPATGTCPKCNGSARQPYTGQYANMIAGYDAATGTVACTNCGGQYMYGMATGRVPFNRNGNPCLHSYKGLSTPEESRRGWHRYECEHCGDRHTIDSGD